MNKRTALAILIIIGMVSNVVAARYYVKYNASGNSDGSSWTDAFTDLQSALAISTYNDTIFVAAGTYKPGTSTSDRFTLPVGGIILGGFKGDENPIDQAVIDARDFTANETILSGDVNGNDNPNILDK